MGYTHRWNRPKTLDKETWDKFIDDAKRLRCNLPKSSKSGGEIYLNEPIALKGAWGTGQYQMSGDVIWLNGNGDVGLDHEGFVIERVFTPDEEIEEFCDDSEMVSDTCCTARKPYDLMVCLTLIALKHHFKDEVEITSDGNINEWKQAVQIFEETIKKKAHEQFKIDHRK